MRAFLCFRDRTYSFFNLIDLTDTSFSEQGAEENIWSWKETTRGYRKLHKQELHNLCPSPPMHRAMKSRKII
jgi:hypothetical protein